MVSLFQTAPEGLGTATPSADGKDNDFFIPSSTFQSIGPEEDDVFYAELTIFADNLPEVTEATQLRLSLPTDGMFPMFETLPHYPSFFIIIEDDDRELFISTVIIIIIFSNNELKLFSIPHWLREHLVHS